MVRRIDPEYGQLLHVSFGREGDQTVRRNYHALPPGVAVERSVARTAFGRFLHFVSLR